VKNHGVIDILGLSAGKEVAIGEIIVNVREVLLPNPRQTPD
jgi:hypothetical protein